MPDPTSQLPKISVVIPVYNGAETISHTLKSVLNQSFRWRYEVIVVDDGSTDNTPQIVQSFSDVKYIRQENAGPAAARNLGFQKSAGDIVFFTDSDCMPHREWIQRALKHFDDSSVAVVAGSYSQGDEGNLMARCIHREIIYRHIFLMPQSPKSFGSYNFSVRRKIFEEIGGFNTHYRYASGEDNDLSYKVLKGGHKIYFAMEVLVQHAHTSKLGKYLREQYRHGFWRAKLYLNHPKMTSGDDYTFWKDIIEPPVVAAFFLAALLFLVTGHLYAIAFAGFVLLFLFIFELIFGCVMIGFSLNENFFWGWIMFLRSFLRTIGFLLGCLALPFQFLPKNKNKFE